MDKQGALNLVEELLERAPEFTVEARAGSFAEGNFVRRYAHLPISL